MGQGFKKVGKKRFRRQHFFNDNLEDFCWVHECFGSLTPSWDLQNHPGKQSYSCNIRTSEHREVKACWPSDSPILQKDLVADGFIPVVLSKIAGYGSKSGTSIIFILKISKKNRLKFWRTSHIQLDPAGYGPPFSSMEIISSMATGHCTAPMAEVKLTTSLSTGSPAVAPLVAQIARHRQAKSGQVTNPSGHVKKSQCMEHNTSRTSRTMENTCGVKKR